MLGERIKLLRQARGLSLDGLAAKAGGIVSKQAISKYERNLSRPSARVLTKIAQALEVKTSNLWTEPKIIVKFIAYRKGSGLLITEENRVEGFVTEMLEQRVKLQELTESYPETEIPVQCKKVDSLEEVEEVACELRTKWNLGMDPIANVTSMLEDHNVFVIQLDATEKFDGISAIAEEDQKVKAAAVVSRTGVPGERQRLNLLHELGHLILRVSPNVDEERAAFRFGAAFLAPREKVWKEIGKSRSELNIEELILFKQRFGLSIQAIIHRLKDLNIINKSFYSSCFININKWGWKKSEPCELKPEEPKWLKKNVLRAVAEGLMTLEKAEHMLGEKLTIEQVSSISQRMAFMRLSLQDRKRILSDQAQKYASSYTPDIEWMEMQGGFVNDPRE
jgi:transcriptional regulator with XRE-family HTH domain